jgi:metabolite-proton symporter
MAHQQTPPAPSVSRRSLVEAVIASTVGTTIEWYDFFLYGLMAALVFPHLFFPSASPFQGQILSFSSYAAGFLTRPVGAMLFGHLGDRVGRKATLVATLLLMGISTLAIGFLPTYNQFGVAAPLLLTAARFIQGIGVGGEWGGSVLLALESGHRGKRGFYASWPQAGVPLGLLASSGAVALFQSFLGPSAFSEWGWRLPFYLSGVLIAVGLLIRIRVVETPLFLELCRAQQLAANPVGQALRHHWREILLAAGTRVAENACFYLFSTYVLAYGKQVLQVEGGLVLGAVNAAAALEFLTIPLFGLCSDWLSRRAIYVVGCLFLIVFAWPYYALLATGSAAAIVIAVIVSLAGGHALLYSVQASLIPELFGTQVRYSAASMGYQLAAPIAGGASPLVAAWLVEAWPDNYWPLVLLVVVVSIISLVCVLSLAETSRKDISTL